MNVYIIDPIPLLREAMAMQVRRLQVTATIYMASDLADFAKITKREGLPDLIVTELNLSDSSGLGTITQIKSLHPHCPLLVFTTAMASLLEDAAIAAGADLFIQKTVSVTDLGHLLAGVLSPDSALTTAMGGVRMSKRQKQLMVMLNDGLSNREIGNKLEISEHTVKVHLWRMFRKIGVKSRTQALVYARQNGHI